MRLRPAEVVVSVREVFTQRLADIEARLDQEFRRIADALETLGQTLDSRDPNVAKRCREWAQRFHAESRTADSDLVWLMALEAPVAADLRRALALVDLAQHGWLIANQFGLIAEQLEQIDPHTEDANSTGSTLDLMATLASAQLRTAMDAFAQRDEQLARRVEAQDDAIDRHNRHVFAATLHLASDSAQRELGMRHVLIARSLERVGDNAVDIGEQAAFLATGKFEEFVDASRARTAPEARDRS